MICPIYANLPTELQARNIRAHSWRPRSCSQQTSRKQASQSTARLRSIQKINS
jgi:hypothetical protein